MNEQGSGLGAGVRIGEYEIVRELGFGGFGITYLARDRVLERLVAVKEYFPAEWGTRRTDGTIGPRTTGAAGDYAWGLERFVDEARALARLDHPAIVKVHRVVEAGGTAYMVMEYVEGRSLAEELQVSGTLPEARVRALLSGLAEGLGAVHAAGLLHRDIKPANVMLRSRDGSPALIDFGAAREQLGRKSRSITTVLTPGYAPIEQYSAKGRQGPWTDVYALGALAYAALSGRVPDDATERVLDDQLAPLDTAAATPVSGGLVRVVDAALAVDMRRRPQDMGEWLALLGEGGPGTAGEVIVAGRGIAAAPEADAGSEGWTAGAGMSPASAGEEAVAAASGGPARRARRRVSPLAVGGAAAVLVGAVAFAVLGRGGDPVADWESGEAALGLGVEDRVLVQRGLLEAGFDPGEWDGLLGVGTRGALREWQSARDLEATGYLTAATAEVLRTVGDSVAAAERVAAAAADSIARAEADAQRLAAAAERRRPGRVFRDCDVCPELVLVPPGSFMMGSPTSEEYRDDDEGPRHRVTIGYTLAVGVYEVTFGEWDACVDAGGCGGHRPEDEGWGRGSRPVIHVNWEDAQAYLTWLSRRTGEGYRLLSEAEWEYVARAGTQTARYWGESVSNQCAFANGNDIEYRRYFRALYYDLNESGVTDEVKLAFIRTARRMYEDMTPVSCSDGYGRPSAPVGSYRANGFGLHDVLGNASEWVEDCWNDSYQGAPSDGGAWTSGDCSRRVSRGGQMAADLRSLRSAFRYRYSAGDWLISLGFRVARTIN